MNKLSVAELTPNGLRLQGGSAGMAACLLDGGRPWPALGGEEEGGCR